MLLLEGHNGESRWAVWKITESEEALQQLLDEKSVKEISSIRSGQRRIESLAVRALVTTILGHSTTIAHNENGAPLLPDESNLHISISHTKGYAAILLSNYPCIGIDIEQISNRVERVKDYFLHTEEKPKSLIGLLLHWCAKESAYKALHQPGLSFRTALKISDFTEELKGSFTLTAKMPKTGEKSLNINYLVGNDFILTMTYN